MARKEILKIVILLFVATIPWLSRYLWEHITPSSISSNYVELVLNILFAAFTGFIFWKAQLKLNLLVSIVLILIVSNHLWNLNQFNDLKEMGQMGISPAAPECFKESNYRDYWDYISNGCGLTIDSVLLNIFYKIIIWLTILPTVFYLFKKTLVKKKKRETKLLDEF